MTTEGFQRILDASEEEQRELRVLRAGGILPLGTPSTPSPAAAAAAAAPAKTPAQSSPAAAGGRRTPGSPSLLAGLVDALRKLPHLATNAKAASERRRRRRGARVRGAAGVAADTLRASGGGEAKGGRERPVVESDLALARRLQGEEDAAARGRDVEMGESGGWRGAGRTGSLARVAPPEELVSPWARDGVAAGSGGLGGGGRVGDDGRDQDGGRDDRRRQALDAATPQQREVSSKELPVSSSGSGSTPLEVSSDSPSTDSPLGARFSSWSDGRGPRTDGPGRSGGGVGGGEGPPRHGVVPPDGAPAGEPPKEWRAGGPQGTTTQELGHSRRGAEEGAATGAGMAHPSSGRGSVSGRGFSRLEDTAEGSSNSSSSRSPGGVATLPGRGASGTPAGFEPTSRQQNDRGAAGAGDPPTGYHVDTAETLSDASSEPRLFQALGDDGPGPARAAGSGSGGWPAPGLTMGALDGSDRVSREDGVEGLEVLSPVVTEDSPNWVLFSDWIGVENGGERGGRHGAGAGRGRLAGVGYWPSPGGGGRDDTSSDSGRERQTGRWFSDESSWSTG